jgi:hypothetical protein
MANLHIEFQWNYGMRHGPGGGSGGAGVVVMSRTTLRDSLTTSNPAVMKPVYMSDIFVVI